MIEASWQPDPDDGQRLRWWDGSQWTEHVAPGPGGEEVGSSPMRTAAGPPLSPGLAPATAGEEAEPAARPAATTGEPGPEPERMDEPADDAGAAGRVPAGEEGRATASPVWTAEAATGTPERAASARVPLPATGAGPVWNLGAATAADDRSKRPFVTTRAVHRIVAAIGVVMLIVASIQMITLRSVSGDSVAEAFYNAVGWGLLGATVWGVCVYSMREIDAERAEARDRAGGPPAGRTP